jgi:hypothetical protein
MDFGYEVVRVWERPAEEWRGADLGVLPLATLGKLSHGPDAAIALGAVVERLVERLHAEAPPESAQRLLTAAFVLTGMRVPRLQARDLFRRVQTMRESDTYMAIIDEGREEEARRLILRLGEQRFGAPSDSVRSALAQINDVDRLERIFDRLLLAAGWSELLETP